MLSSRHCRQNINNSKYDGSQFQACVVFGEVTYSLVHTGAPNIFMSSQHLMFNV